MSEATTLIDPVIETATSPEAEKPAQLTAEERKELKAKEKKLQQELQRQYNMVKKKLKMRSKSELVAMLWEQGIAYKELQHISQQMYEELKSLKGESNAQENSEESN